LESNIFIQYARFPQLVQVLLLCHLLLVNFLRLYQRLLVAIVTTIIWVNYNPENLSITKHGLSILQIVTLQQLCRSQLIILKWKIQKKRMY